MDEFRDPVLHLPGVRVLHRFAGEREPDVEDLGVGDELRRGDERPERGEGLAALPDQPVRAVAVVAAALAVSHIVHQRVAEDVALRVGHGDIARRRPDHHREFAFPVQLLPAGFHQDGLAVADGDGAGLHEQVGVLPPVAGRPLPEVVHGYRGVVERGGVGHLRRPSGGHLLAVRGVVQRRGQDQARTHRREVAQPVEFVDPHRPLLRREVEQRRDALGDGVDAFAHSQVPSPGEFVHVLRHREAHEQTLGAFQRSVRAVEFHRERIPQDDAEECFAPPLEGPQPKHFFRGGGAGAEARGREADRQREGAERRRPPAQDAPPGEPPPRRNSKPRVRT